MMFDTCSYLTLIHNISRIPSDVGTSGVSSLKRAQCSEQNALPRMGFDVHTSGKLSVGKSNEVC